MKFLKHCRKTISLVLALALVLTSLCLVPASAVTPLGDNLDDILLDIDWYYAHNPDLQRAFGYNREALKNHFFTCGIVEGRRPSILFDAKVYAGLYPDLKAAFGDNWKALYEHFRDNGIREGRQGSSEFNVEVYKANNEDLRRAFGTGSSSNWLYLRHFREFGQNEGRIAVQGSSTQTYYVKTSGGNLNVRASASTSSRSLGLLANGTAVQVYSISGGWACISYNGGKGYVSSSYLSQSSPNATSTYYVKTSGGNLNVRASASSSSRSLGLLANGTAVQVYSISGGWACISYNGGKGYVSSSYLSQTKPSASTSTYYVKTSGGNLNVRASASSYSRSLGLLANGTAVQVYSISGGWACISYNGGKGYVSSSYLSQTKPSTTPNTSISGEAGKILDRLNAMMNGSYGGNTYKVGTRYTGTYASEQCKGFAKRVFEILFGYNIGSTIGKPYNYKLDYDSSKTSLVGSLSSLNSSNVASLFAKARPGDFIQVRRSHTGSHSMIFLSATSSNVTVYECNVDGANGIEKNTYSWSTFCSKNVGVSVYTCRNYWLH